MGTNGSSHPQAPGAQIVDWAKDFARLAASEEPLHPDLEPYFEESGPIGPSLRHPLVYEVFGVRPGIVNQRYAAKKAALDEALEKGNWHKAVFLHERPYRIDALQMLRDDYGERISAKAYWELVGSVWTDSENIWQNRPDWDSIFEEYDHSRMAEYIMDDDERAKLHALPDVVTIYRGAISDFNEDGLSWTLDKDRAAWFARRFVDSHGGDPVVLHGRVAKHGIMAYFDGRNEDEIVVWPEDAVDIFKVEAVNR
jgi:hypothetical protein